MYVCMLYVCVSRYKRRYMKLIAVCHGMPRTASCLIFWVKDCRMSSHFGSGLMLLKGLIAINTGPEEEEDKKKQKPK